MFAKWLHFSCCCSALAICVAWELLSSEDVVPLPAALPVQDSAFFTLTLTPHPGSAWGPILQISGFASILLICCCPHLLTAILMWRSSIDCQTFWERG